MKQSQLSINIVEFSAVTTLVLLGNEFFCCHIVTNIETSIAHSTPEDNHIGDEDGVIYVLCVGVGAEIMKDGDETFTSSISISSPICECF